MDVKHTLICYVCLCGRFSNMVFLRFFFSLFDVFDVFVLRFFFFAVQYWKAAELRPPGGLQLAPQKSHFLCPNVVSMFFNCFCMFFTVTVPWPPLKEICLQGGRVRGGMEKETVSCTFPSPFFQRLFLSFCSFICFLLFLFLL